MFVGLSCAQPPAEPDLESLPGLDLEAADANARSQITEKSSELDRLLASPDAPAPERAKAFSDLGLVLVAYDFLESAETCFDNAVQLEASNFRWHYFLGYVELQQGRLEAAMQSLERALELAPDLLPAMLRMGRAEVELGRPEAARSWFEKALEIEPGTAAAHEGLGRIDITEGRFESGIDHLQRALELDPEATGVNYALAQATRQAGDLELAKSYLERSGDVATRIPDPLVEPLAMLAESAQFYLVQAAEAMADEDFETAAGSYRAALEQDPQSFVAYRGLARCLALLGDQEDAIETLEQALKAAEKDESKTAEEDERLWIFNALAELELSLNREPEASRRWDRSLEISPQQPAILLRSANLLARAARFDQALERYDRLLALEPLWAAVIRERRATVLVNLGRKQEAIAEFERALEAAPEDLRLRYRFAEALAHLGEVERSRAQHEALTRMRGEDEKSIQLMIEEARRLTREGAYEAAVERFREAVEQAPELLELRFELASILGHLGLFDDAVAEFEQVLASAPRHEAAHRGLTVAMILTGRFGEARKQLQEALRTFPRHAGFALMQVRLLAAAPDPGVRDGSLALEIAHRVWQERRDPSVQEAMALAYAAAGQTEDARGWQEGLIAARQAAWSPEVREVMADRLATFERGEAWSVRSPHEIVAGLDAGS